VLDWLVFFTPLPTLISFVVVLGFGFGFGFGFGAADAPALQHRATH
jgi:hypothetical protein